MRKAEKHALDFINRCNGWHSYDTRDQSTVNAIKNLAKRNEIDVSFETGQFRSIAAMFKDMPAYDNSSTEKFDPKMEIEFSSMQGGTD